MYIRNPIDSHAKNKNEQEVTKCNMLSIHIVMRIIETSVNVDAGGISHDKDEHNLKMYTQKQN
jgi:hypothetical protein